MIYVLAGHTPGKDPGAVSGNRQEALLTKELRDMVTTELSSKGAKFKTDRDDQSLSEVIADIKSTEKDVILDIHFNAAAPEANGVEVIIPQRSTEAERFYGFELCKAVNVASTIRIRGVKDETKTARGRLAIMKPQGLNLLVEVAFITNEQDMTNYEGAKAKIASSIAQLLIDAQKHILK